MAGPPGVAPPSSDQSAPSSVPFDGSLRTSLSASSDPASDSVVSGFSFVTGEYYPVGVRLTQPRARSCAIQSAGTRPRGPGAVSSAGRLRGAPRSFAEAQGRIDAAPPAASVTDRFRSPSGNIVCRRSTDAGTAACEVAKGRVDPPLPSICPAGGPQDIGRIELGPGGALPVCNSDTIRTGGEPELGYGKRTQPSGTTACLSESFGVTCIDTASRHGFFLARDTFVTF